MGKEGSRGVETTRCTRILHEITRLPGGIPLWEWGEVCMCRKRTRDTHRQLEGSTSDKLL